MSTTYQGLITITDLTDNKACEIRGVNVFKYNENGEIPSASSSITLTAILSDNISGSNWQYKNSLGNFVDFSPITTGDTITINHTDDIFINDVATIKKLTSDESVFDIFTITKIRDGSPGDALISASLSNDNQTIPCDGNGIPFESSFPISSKITIYEGAEDITNKYSISVTIQSDSGVPRLIGSISGDTFTATSWNALSQSYYTATVTFTCTRTGYPPINKVLTLSKVTTGSSPNYYELTYDILATNKNISNIFNPSSVTFRANHVNGELTEDYQGYLKLYRVKLDGTQETITASNMISDGASGYKYTYTFSQTLDANTKYLLAELYKTDGVGDYLDKQSIIVTSDGQTGTSPINIVLGNVADVIPCDVNGKLKTDLIINIPFTAYKGTSQISATINKSNITTRPSNLTDDDITITSSTTSSSGNIQFKLYAGSELGNNSGEITLTFTCDEKQVPMKYGWSKSIQAKPGADGKTYYTWIKYADSPTSGMSDNPSGKAYIGIAHNKTSATESTTYSDYTWSLIKGETGADGNGITTIKQYYARTTTFSKPSAESITSTTMPGLDNTYRYLWMKEVISFTKSENQTVITLIAARGDNGEMSPEQVAQLNKASQDASNAVSKVDNLEIGGRNLAKRENITANFNSFSKIDGYEYTQWVGAGAGILFPADMFTEGTEYVLSFKFQKVSGTLTSIAGHSTAFETRNVVINGESFPQHWIDTHPIEDSDAVQTCVVYLRRHIASENSETNYNLYIQPQRNQYHGSNDIMIKYWDIKIEKGNRATDWTPAPEDVQSNIDGVQNNLDNLEIGGRNLILDSETMKISKYIDAITTETGITVSEWGTNNAIRSYGVCSSSTIFGTLATGSYLKAASGQAYVHSIYVKNNGGTAISISNNGLGGSHIIQPGESTRVILYGTGNGTNYLQFVFMCYNVGDAVDITYWHPKIEKGDKATDWTPAPEDVDAGIKNAAKVATNYITDISESNGVEVKSSLDSNNKVQIKSDGMHVYQNINNTSTEVALFGNTARIGKQNDTRFEVNADNLSAYSGPNKYFKVSPTGMGFGDNQQVLEFDPETNGLTISIPDSLYKIKITNEKIEFINTGSIDPIATISGQSLTIPKSTMLDEMQVGDKCWSWRVKDDKSLQLKWIG